MIEEEKKRREENKRIFEVYRDEINKRDLSNTESFDKALLSLSSAGLAVSLSFIKFIVPLEEIENMFFLYLTWVLFALTIILVILSILISQIVLKKALFNAEEYYVNDKKEYRNKEDNWTKVMDWFPLVQSVSFIFAIISVIMFVTLNFKKTKDINMIDKNRITQSKEILVGTEGAKVPVMQKTTVLMDGASVPLMQLNEGANTPSMQVKTEIVNKGANTPNMQKKIPQKENSLTPKKVPSPETLPPKESK